MTYGHSQEFSNQKDSLAVVRVNHYLSKLQLEYKDGNYARHKLYSDSLYTLAKEKSLPKFQILGMVNQAVFHNNSGEQEKSIRLYRDALTLAEDIPEDYRTKIIVLVNLGNVYTNIESHEKAIAIMNEVLSMLDNHEDNPKIRAAAYNGLANNHESLGETEISLSFHLKSKKLGEDIKNESIVVTALSNISDTYLRLEEYEKAREHINNALSIPYAQKPTKQRAWLLLNRGIAEQHIGSNTNAITYFIEAKELAVAKGLPEIEMEAYDHLVTAYEKNNDLENKRVAYEKFLSLQNSILENRQSATKMDLKQDIAARDNIIKSKESIITKLLENKNRLLLWSIAFACILGIVSFSFFLNKKKYQREQELLQEQFASLRNSYQYKSESTFLEHVEPSITRTPGYKNSSLTEEDFAKYKALLLHHMTTEKPYLNNELSQSDLANELGISSHHLSEILNSGFNQNFYNFINSYRVLEAQKLMDNDTTKEFKILAFAFDAGFKSKTSFNRVFKNHTGLTPSEYRKKTKS
jgi:AraC-like DNA-binding protein